MTRFYRSGTAVLSTLMAVLGLVLLGQGAVTGKPVGLLLGALFLAAGLGRLHLLRRR